jgi:hypothetical protein
MSNSCEELGISVETKEILNADRKEKMIYVNLAPEDVYRGKPDPEIFCECLCKVALFV